MIPGVAKKREATPPGCHGLHYCPALSELFQRQGRQPGKRLLGFSNQLHLHQVNRCFN